MTYKQAGVDIEAGAAAVRLLKKLTAATKRPEVISELGGFNGLFAADFAGYRQPVLTAATDGVGTKLKIAQALDEHQTIGVDLVAMVVNDLVTSGAEPLFFLDYLSVGKVEPQKVATIVGGIADGCRQAGCALIGGETAEHPGIMAPREYDLAGFGVGVVEREKIIDGRQVKSGDKIIALASNGLHANGYSLVRAALGADEPAVLKKYLTVLGETLGAALLRPTCVYVKAVSALHREGLASAAAHITGGGIKDNLSRVLPGDKDAVIDMNAWPRPAIFELIKEQGRLDEEEMRRTFNLGAGMMVIVPSAGLEKARNLLDNNDESAYVCGEIRDGSGRVVLNG